MTAQSLIESALRLIGVLASGETASAAEASDALSILNDMIDEWQTERLLIFAITRHSFSHGANLQNRTFGSGGNFNADRPVRIERAGVESLTNPSVPLEIPIDIYTWNEWRKIPDKTVTASLPKVVWVDYTFPLINLYYWPIPDETVNEILYGWTAITSFAALATDNTYPPAYAKALRYNLALDLAPEYGRSVPAEVAAQAMLAKAKIKTINTQIPTLSIDSALTGQGGHYDWRSDSYQ